MEQAANLAFAEEMTLATSTKMVDLHYLNEKELTVDEQKVLENFQQSQIVETDDVAYYYVYRPSQKTLPNTGSSEIAGLMLAGATLLVVTLVLSRKNKSLAVTLFALGSGGILTTTVLADSQLAQLFENAQVVVNGTIPQPKAIDGYEFTGYFYRRKESKTTPLVAPQLNEELSKSVISVTPIHPTELEKSDTPEKEDITAKGDQNNGGSANTESVLPEFTIPTEAKGDQTGNILVNEQPTPKDGRDEFEDYALDGKAALPEAKVREIEETTVLPFNTIIKEDLTLEKGQTKVEVAGTNGQKVTKVREFYTVSRDGKEEIVLRTILSEEVTPAVDQLVLLGAKEVEPSPVAPVPESEPSLPSPVAPVPESETTLPSPVTPNPEMETTLPSPDTPNPEPETTLPSPVTPVPEPEITLPTPVTPVPEPGPALPSPVAPVPEPETTLPTPEPETDLSTPAPEELAPIPQPKVETVEIEPTVRYEADPSREVGSENITISGEKGLQTTTTTYERDAQTGELKEKTETVVTKPAGETVIKVAVKPTEKREELPTVYNGNINQAFGTPDITTAGTPKVTTTTYTVNPQTGQVTPREEVTETGQATVITKGIQSREITETLPTVYRGDDSQDVGTETDTPGTLKVTTIAYQVDAATGVVTPIETLTNPGNARVVVKGTKPTTRPEDLPVVYKRSDDQALGTETTTAGTPKITTTTYTVNAQTGVVTSTETITDAGTATIVTKGTQAKVEETPIKYTRTYKEDAATPYNTQVTETAGVDGKTVITTTYSLNEQTGEVTANTPTTATTSATNAVIKVGNVQTTTAEIAITEQAERVQDPNLDKGKTRVVTEGEKGETTTTTTYTVDPQTGVLSNPQTTTVTTKEMKQRVIAEGTRALLQPTDSIISETYRVRRGEVNLYGVITASSNYRNENRPLAIISHGFNNTLEMNSDYANFLARLGYVVYSFDFYGGSRNSKSGGTDMLNMSVLTEKADLTAVVDQLSQESFVNKDAITLMGVSQGGAVSTLYAAENPDKVDKLVLIFPAFVLFDDVQETYRNLGVSSPDQIPAVITHRNARLGSIYLKDALDIDINSEIQKVKASTIIVHGTNDNVVPYRYAVNANNLFADSELVTVQGGGHWLDTNFNRIARPAIERFVKQ